MAKSPDAFRTISEVADWLGTPTHVLRFWESRFNQVKPVKRAGGRRYYRPADMALLGGIKKLLHDDGLTIRGVQKILREEGVKHVAAMSPPIDGLEDQAQHIADDLAAQEMETPAEPPIQPPEEPALPFEPPVQPDEIIEAASEDALLDQSPIDPEAPTPAAPRAAVDALYAPADTRVTEDFDTSPEEEPDADPEPAAGFESAQSADRVGDEDVGPSMADIPEPELEADPNTEAATDTVAYPADAVVPEDADSTDPDTAVAVPPSETTEAAPETAETSDLGQQDVPQAEDLADPAKEAAAVEPILDEVADGPELDAGTEDPEPVLKATTGSVTDPVAEPEAALDADAGPQLDPDQDKEPGLATAPEPVSDPEPVTEPTVEPEAVLDTEPVSELASIEEPEPVAEPEQTAESVTLTDPAADSEPTLETEPVSDSSPSPEAQDASEAMDDSALSPEAVAAELPETNTVADTPNAVASDEPSDPEPASQAAAETRSETPPQPAKNPEPIPDATVVIMEVQDLLRSGAVLEDPNAADLVAQLSALRDRMRNKESTTK